MDAAGSSIFGRGGSMGPEKRCWSKSACAVCPCLFPHQAPALLTGPNNPSLLHPFQVGKNVVFGDLEPQKLHTQATTGVGEGEPSARRKTRHLGKSVFQAPSCLCSWNMSVWVYTSTSRSIKENSPKKLTRPGENLHRDSIWTVLHQRGQLTS